MSKLLYLLEDHFDAVAQTRQGSISGWLSRGLRSLFGVAGDVLQASIVGRRF